METVGGKGVCEKEVRSISKNTYDPRGGGEWKWARIGRRSRLSLCRIEC